ncbi:major mannose-resistant fimbrial protein [Xenorhabdus mauleonii]|uniref:Major mannose-resistant fimbrial protein n=1 Tax=Xenorhabdus mauleonii TaxID=351675 RepID=A0A1I3VNG3_9GAMM|nr:fimbrial protein [Xenorhabdus mauleonii]PHM37423.1 major mannose-resistant fimbrial protein [Xenorhabdus mauleonii]SFJ95671.1 Pilin (type 1 fimbria component protein) [Xenorhabdus mauleonii]
MKLNKLAMVLGFGVALTAGAANAANSVENMNDRGFVHFKGTIINPTCSIKNPHIDVNFGEVRTSKFKSNKDGQSERIPFDIILENCADITGKKISTTFTGDVDSADGDLLAIRGEAKGVGIQIGDLNDGENGRMVRLGHPTTAVDAVDNRLRFDANLKTIPGQNVTTGNFFAFAHFTLSYL